MIRRRCLAYAAMLVFLGLVAAGCDTPTPDQPAAKNPPSPSPSNAQPPKAPPLAKPPAPASLPVWKPDPTLVEQLGPYEDISGFQLRPPKGYQRTQFPGAPAGATAVAWVGAPRGDGTRPMVVVTLVNVPPQPGSYTLQEAFDRTLANLKKLRTDWQQTPTQSGQVGGMTCLKAGWQGTMRETGMKIHGLDYASMDGATLILIRTQDVEPHHDQALKLGNAAILTFRKK